MGKATHAHSIKVKAASKSKSGSKVSDATSVETIKLNAPQTKIMETMGKLAAMQMEGPSRDMVQSFSGHTKTKEGFTKNLGKLKKLGLMTTGSTCALTEKGKTFLKVLGIDLDQDDISNETMLASIKEMVAPKARDLLDALWDGTVHDRKETAQALNYDLNKLTGYQKILSNLSSLGFLKKNTTSLQLTDKCYPLGRPNGTTFSL